DARDRCEREDPRAEVRVVLQGRLVVLLEAARDEVRRGHDDEREREQEKRQNPAPGQAETSSGARRKRAPLDNNCRVSHRSKPGSPCLDRGLPTHRYGAGLGEDTPTTESHCVVIRVLAAFSWSRVGKTVPVTSGSFAAA